MRRFYIYLIGLLVILGIPIYSFAGFSDINENTTYSQAINYAQENGIVKGYEDGTFKPDKEITRAEFTKIIINSIYEDNDIYGENCFLDVHDEWFAKYICTAKRREVINGYEDGLFRPENKISFIEASKIILLGFQYNIAEDTNVWYKPFIQELSDRNAIPTTIDVINKLINRGEMVEIIWRLKENKTNESSMIYSSTNDILTNSYSILYSDISSTNNWYKPDPGTSWQWQLTGDINTSYDVDLYDIDLEETPQEVIDDLHQQGKKVICYFNGGAYEPYRTDSYLFPDESLGKSMEGWENEKWLDIAHFDKFSGIMKGRLDLAVEKGCDGVEPDNMDGYQNDTGFAITYKDQIYYNLWIATEAHKRALSVALKNDVEQVKDLVDDFDFAVNEQCFEYEECDYLLPFIEQGKAVLGVEYDLSTSEFCSEANAMNFSWLKMEYDLDGGRTSCR